ncbi:MULTISPECIES: TniQ family protein [Cellulosimicrobium]|uniref:TniQ family protein n=1 Tax=Cellulosimicrobium TaxID=157920 RepID=UPI0007747119|nr:MULTISPECIES: TniQ family protein [Cellulosimicrobium]
MTRRWPLHPPPGDGEALSSWLNRLAEIYGLSVEELIRHDLLPPGADPIIYDGGALDLDPPPGVLTALHRRTGVPLGELRQMTIAGWAPWLLDTLDVEPEAGAALDTYLHQDSVLLTAKERPRRQVPGWRAWLPSDLRREPIRRACPTCLSTTTAGTPGFTLVSQLPLTLSCSQHGCRLEPAFGALGGFVAWAKQDTNATAAPVPVVAMDALTHEGLHTGLVTLPRRRVHVGMWFRLLRTLIDELSTPVSMLRVRSRHTMQHLWHVTGHPPRAGMAGPWRPYEALPWPQQRMLLEAAATTLQLVEAGDVTAHGTLGHLLTPEPYRPVPDGSTPPQRRRDHWQEIKDEMNRAIARAQRDPAAARQLLATLTALTRSETTFRRTREDLVALGVPERHLPRTRDDVHARDAPPVQECALVTSEATAPLHDVEYVTG